MDPRTRFVHTIRKLNSIRDEPIICLQEVSKEWADLYAKHFESKKYSFIHVQYGHEFNGYMGTAIAFPNSKYQMKHNSLDVIREARALVTYTYEGMGIRLSCRIQFVDALLSARMKLFGLFV